MVFGSTCTRCLIGDNHDYVVCPHTHTHTPRAFRPAKKPKLTLITQRIWCLIRIAAARNDTHLVVFIIVTTT